MNKERTSTSNIYNVILYLSGLFLFLEWLYPIEQVTDTSSITIFVIYAMFCFFVSVIHLKWWVGFLFKGFGMLFILHGLYFDSTFLSRDWFGRLAWEIATNVDILVSQNWYFLSPLFRSFLFLLLIWLMSYLLYYWFVQMKRIFLFIALTFIYIAVLDTFTLYEADFAIIRIFVISLIALGLANFNRDMERERIAFRGIKRKVLWVLPFVLTLTFSVVIGLAAPKLDPQWPDPVPFFESAKERVTGSGSSSVRKVGYGEDDSQLGGSFIQDDTPVFQVEANKKQYWRIETKDVYTGKGWEASSDSIYFAQPEGLLELRTFYPSVKSVESSASITFLDGQNFNKLVYPYGVRQIHTASHDADYYLDQVTEAIEPMVQDEEIALEHYELVYDQPSFSLTTLRESSGTEEQMLDEYLQLPDTLPDRVGELAEEITKNHDTQYEKVRAIERYFSSNDFTYQTTGVAVPGEGEDYVDQFLFETQVGYCDNFSTSMVVMLRTQDIPARWVKGFTGGEAIGEGVDDDHQIYEVTNANAHSWVEVFFPETGWVPFEPTQGFSNPTDFHLDQTERDIEENDDVLDASQPELPESDMPQEEDSEPAMAAASDDRFSISWTHLGIGLVILLAVMILMYKYRLQIKTNFYKYKLDRTNEQKVFQDAYHHLLLVLEHEGYERKEDQTLREFASRIDNRYQSDDMQILTNYYERMIYRNDFNPADLEQLKGSWKKLIKMITG